ncbi:HAD family hydrolase [Thalassotalea marina]|uniref:Phosphoglycolate phosphatase n=1 Tax=Thalassotalea marina TaxID=1673741 RepID=A0A919BKB3_9GAMM|nr:HAD-IA family hydrolase [Thalassotalea marina]GHF93269.1 phosphoglycolate phosphatase [Thalassotalea marina]
MQSKSIKAVLFDLDGTLLDTADDLGSALNHVLEQHNLPTVTPEAYRPIASNGAKGLLELGFAEQLSKFNFDQLREQFLDYYQNNIAQKTSLYGGVPALLETLNSNNIAWGVVTNKPEYLTTLLLPYFDEFTASQIMVGGDTLTQRKPHPAPLLYAAQAISIAPEQCLYVGDALRDIEAGNAANMTTVIAEWGYIKEDENLSLWQADFSCKKPQEILSFI